MTVGDLVNVREAGKILADLDLPIRAAFEISRLLLRVENELRPYEEQRLALFQKYGEDRVATEEERKFVGGSTVRSIKPEHLETFSKAQAELMSIPIDFPSPITITLGDGLLVKPKVLMALSSVLIIEAPNG